MAASYSYRETCPCGAELNIHASDDFVITSKVDARIKEWQQKHAGCLPLAKELIKVKVKLMDQRHKNLLCGGG